MTPSRTKLSEEYQDYLDMTIEAFSYYIGDKINKIVEKIRQFRNTNNLRSSIPEINDESFIMTYDMLNQFLQKAKEYVETVKDLRKKLQSIDILGPKNIKRILNMDLK